MQSDMEEERVNFDSTFIFDEAQFVHEETQVRAVRSDHLRKHLTADYSDHGIGLFLFAEIQKKK
jgi:hypothetical protein